MTYLVGNAPPSELYQQVDFLQFLEWIRMQKIYQLDVETSFTPYWCDKKLITLQFGDDTGQQQWMLQWSFLREGERLQLKEILEDPGPLKVIHNALFEAVVLLFHGIRITNVYDTMLMEMILYCGQVLNEDNPEDESNFSFYSLGALVQRYLCKTLDKSEQTNFGDDILSQSKVLYGIEDVKHLSAIRRMQMLEISRFDLDYVAALENEVVLAYAEITYNGMELDKELWLANEKLAEPVVAQARSELNEWLLSDPDLREKATQLGYISEYDKLTINWNSPVQRKAALEYYFPFLEGKTSKATLDKLLRDHKKAPVFSDDRVIPYVEAIRDKNWPIIEQAIIQIDKQWLIDHDFMIPANTPVINWNSQAQVLPLLQAVHKGLPDLSAESMSRFIHPIGKSLENYKDALKLISTYGQAFIKKYVEPDGKVRTTFTQVVSTGRVSSKKPKLNWAA